ncbi:MFS transporter [Anoxybacterium hadale]|uniref:MFS transporter n=1 Tax=Anoxybacterium hadale TaxID=3408580 RepID=A0ACD1AGR2_9FIRM|nr:MFS transporter [Clostridiales bacterium]
MDKDDIKQNIENNSDVKNNGRNWVIVILFLGWMFACIDRNLMSISMVQVQDEFGINATTTGMILSAFFLGCIIIQLPGGLLVDKWGARNVLLVATLAWAVFTGLTAIAWSVAALFVVRVIFGFFDGFFPNASSKTIAETFPLRQRARAKSLVMIGGTVGTIIAAGAGAPLVVAHGWRMTFFYTALIGLSIFLLYFFGLRRSTAGGAAAANTAEQKPNVSVKSLLKQRVTWALFFTALSIQFVGWGVSSWMPIYLVRARGVDIETMGMLVALSSAVIMLAALFVGYLLDKISGYEKYFAIFGGLSTAIFLVLLTTASNAIMAVIFQTLASLGCVFVNMVVMTNPLKRYPVEAVGTANGIIATGSQLGSFLSPLVMGITIDASGGSFTSGFLLLAGFVLIAAAAGSQIPVIKGLNKPKNTNVETKAS